MSALKEEGLGQVRRSTVPVRHLVAATAGSGHYTPQYLGAPGGGTIAPPSGIVPVTGVDASGCLWTLIASGPFVRPFNISPQATIEHLGIFSIKDVFYFYQLYATVSPYFTWHGYLFHVVISGKTISVYVCSKVVHKNVPGLIVGMGKPPMLNAFPERARGLGRVQDDLIIPATLTGFGGPVPVPPPPVGLAPGLAPLTIPSSPAAYTPVPKVAPPVLTPVPGGIKAKLPGLPSTPPGFTPPVVAIPSSSPAAALASSLPAGTSPAPVTTQPMLPASSSPPPIVEVVLGVLAFGVLGGVLYLVFGDS